MPSPEFVANSYRYDPYLNYRFKVLWDNTTVAGISKVSALTRTTKVVEHRVGGDPSVVRKQPGQTSYAAITLERGVTHDKAFEQWANKSWYYGQSTQQNPQQLVSLQDFRKDIIIQLFNEAGQLAIQYNVYRCWVSEFKALPDLDSKGDAVAIQTLKLENEGWLRTDSVTEPTQTALTMPA